MTLYEANKAQNIDCLTLYSKFFVRTHGLEEGWEVGCSGKGREWPCGFECREAPVGCCAPNLAMCLVQAKFQDKVILTMAPQSRAEGG